MKRANQIIAIAETQGWIRDEICDNWKNPSEGKYAIAFMNGSHAHRQLPNYLEDLDAVAAVRKSLSKSQQTEFIRHLETIVSRNPNANLWSWALVDATAPQQCEAILRTFKKWTK